MLFHIKSGRFFDKIIEVIDFFFSGIKFTQSKIVGEAKVS